jgi:hypothetical protein
MAFFLSEKRQFLRRNFGENIFEIITSVPDSFSRGYIGEIFIGTARGPV